MDRKLRILIVDDSPTCREYLKYLFEKDGGFQVVGTARDGLEAVSLALALRPDVITMDVLMPRLDGIQASRRILEKAPIRIVIISDVWNTEEVRQTFAAMEMGVLASVQKPPGPASPGNEAAARQLVRTVKLLAEIPVVHRWKGRERAPAAMASPRPVSAAENVSRRLVVVGASTGGPPVLKTILSRLPANYPLPLLVVQHISPGFLPGMIQWLQKVCALRLRIATHGERLEPGTVYFAPDGTHMVLGDAGEVALYDGPPEHGVRPSVSALFRSVANLCSRDAVAVLLTGMGRDGAQELKTLHDKGALTVAQDEASCVVFGMPGEAVRLGAAQHVLDPEGITDLLLKVVSDSR
ncbi:chemotaxis-specific protein-glutamate methyltransferase CheB [Desulfacinum hydrothermale]|uniref:chemotaxis-specific protein-glutamate methyltransferase CheB n=1 Tax=Desulfacinum hydrothermale TaxID=109258 RepID=UPI001BAFAF15|nr:chemotaxis-specific protein-glutamate methyltransferase CheB [Desulfacinum hydrothermale]